MRDYFNYLGKVCVITGAASGIGKATAEMLVELNAEVYILDKNTIRVPGAKYIYVDLNDKDSIDSAFNEIPERIDSFFGVAGLSGAITDYYTTFTVNYIANKYITEVYLKNRMSDGGSICYVSSVGGLHWDKYYKEFEAFTNARTWEEMTSILHKLANPNTPGFMAYPLSKRALNYYMAKQSLEMGTIGVRVNALLPGSTDTSMKKEFENSSDKLNILLEDTGVAKRLATPEEMAEPLIFLNSDMARFISGVPLVVDFASNAMVKLKVKKDKLDTKVGPKILNMGFIQNILKKPLDPLNKNTDNSSDKIKFTNFNNSEFNDIDNTETKNIKVIEPNTEELEKLDDEIL